LKLVVKTVYGSSVYIIDQSITYSSLYMEVLAKWDFSLYMEVSVFIKKPVYEVV